MQKKISDKSTKTALILCIIFLPLGIHRFYVGRIYTGLLMFIPGVIWYSWQIYRSITALTLLGLPSNLNLHDIGKIAATTSASSQGLAELILPWIGWLLIIWSIIDIFQIVFGRFKDKYGFPLKPLLNI